MSDAWPSPDAQPGLLPRIEDLPLVERGYDQEAVQAAFDAFYRHAAQLDATLRALEAVEVFRRDADALRNDLRAIRDLGGFGAGEPAWAAQTYDRVRSEVPAVAIRLLFEAALIVAVAVIAGVSHLRSTLIVALMAAAFLVVAFAEWLAARARWVAPVGGFVSQDSLEPAPYVEVPAWGGAASPAPEREPEPDEETESDDALTMVVKDPWEADDEPADDDDEPADDELAEGEPAEGEPADDDDEPDADAATEPEPAAHGFFRRRRR